MSQTKPTKNNNKYDPNKKVVIVVEMQHFEPLRIKVKLKTRWEKIIKAFGESKGLDTSKLRFLFDEHQVNKGTFVLVGDAVCMDMEDFEQADKDNDGYPTFKISVMSEGLGGG